MAQTVIFYSGYANNTWIRTFFARNHQALEAEGIIPTGVRNPQMFVNARDYQSHSDPALMLAEVGSCLARGLRIVLAPAHNCNFVPEPFGRMLRLCRKNFPDVRLVWHFNMTHPVDSLLYNDSLLCLLDKVYLYTPKMLNRLIRGAKKTNLDLLQHTVVSIVDEAIFIQADVSSSSMRRELDSLLALAGINQEREADGTLDYTPPALMRSLTRESKAWVLALKDLFIRFGDPGLEWNAEGAVFAEGDPLLPALPKEECLRFENAYLHDKKYFVESPVLGQSWEEFLKQDIPPFSGLTAADAEHFFSLHTPEFSAKVKAYLSALDPRLFTGQETLLFAPWLRGLDAKFSQAVPEKINLRIEVCAPPQPKVSVLTSTYNHALFIRDCLEGVVAQKTDFHLEHIVADDGSTDGTAEIIKDYASRYPHIVPVLHDFHVGGAVNHRDMYRMAKAPYIALCDGDDYFCDPGKLRMQAALLDNNPDLALCFHPVRVTFESGRFGDYVFPNLAMLPRGIRPFYHLSDLLRWNMIQTNSVMYRWRFSKGIPDWLRMDLLPGDWYLHLIHAETGKIGFINQLMGVYRRHEASQYYTVEENRLLHRHKVGLEELETYRAINEHFNQKYESIVNRLATAVITDFLVYAEENDNDANLRAAAGLYPEFMHYAHNAINAAKMSAPVQQKNEG